MKLTNPFHKTESPSRFDEPKPTKERKPMSSPTPIHLAILIMAVMAVAYAVTTALALPSGWAANAQKLAPVLGAFAFGLIVAEKWLDKRS